MSSFEFLTSLQLEAKAHLQVAWDEIGATEKEVYDSVTRMQDACKRAFAHEVENARVMKTQLEDQITSMKGEIRGIYSVLGLPSDPALDTFKHATLRECIRFLHVKTEEAHKLRAARLAEVNKELQILHLLWRELGVPYKPGFEGPMTDFSSARIDALNGEIQAAKQEKEARYLAIRKRCEELVHAIRQLGVTGSSLTPLDRAALNGELDAFGVHSSVISRLHNRTRQLEKIRDEREKSIRGLAREITTLWKRLEIPNDVQEAFFQKNHGLNLTTIRACEEELHRLRALKRERLADFVFDARTRLKKLWDEQHVSVEERQCFAPFYADKFTEALLEQHEKEVARLEVRGQALSALFRLVKRRSAIRESIPEYDRMRSDPERFLHPRQLMEEERLRRKIHYVLPQVETELLERIDEFERVHSTVFTIDGQGYKAAILADQAADVIKKQHEIDARNARREAQKRIKHSNNDGTGKPKRSSSTKLTKRSSSIKKKQKQKSGGNKPAQNAGPEIWQWGGGLTPQIRPGPVTAAIAAVPDSPAVPSLMQAQRLVRTGGGGIRQKTEIVVTPPPSAEQKRLYTASPVMYHSPHMYRSPRFPDASVRVGGGYTTKAGAPEHVRSMTLSPSDPSKKPQPQPQPQTKPTPAPSTVASSMYAPYFVKPRLAAPVIPASASLPHRYPAASGVENKSLQQGAQVAPWGTPGRHAQKREADARAATHISSLHQYFFPNSLDRSSDRQAQASAAHGSGVPSQPTNKRTGSESVLPEGMSPLVQSATPLTPTTRRHYASAVGGSAQTAPQVSHFSSGYARPLPTSATGNFPAPLSPYAANAQSAQMSTSIDWLRQAPVQPSPGKPKSPLGAVSPDYVSNLSHSRLPPAAQPQSSPLMPANATPGASFSVWGGQRMGELPRF